jgi:hypothetical protein
MDGRGCQNGSNFFLSYSRNSYIPSSGQCNSITVRGAQTGKTEVQGLGR